MLSASWANDGNGVFYEDPEDPDGENGQDASTDRAVALEITKIMSDSKPTK
jgi:hypothetical protein